MIQINITGPNATVTQTETLTAGRVGLECAFTFDSAWDGLNKIAVCEGTDTKGVVMETGNDTIVIPWECLADPGYKLRIGVRGENSSGDIVIPTVWARVGKISDSPGDDVDPGQEATPSVVQQIQETAANALYIARGVKAEADSGAFNGEDGYSPTVTVTSITGGNTVTITDANGNHAFNVMDGDPGVYIGSTQPTDPDTSVWIDTTGGPDLEIHNVPAGGTSGQVLAKASGTDYDLEWVNQSGGGGSVTVDDALSGSSENPVQNKVIKAALDGKGTYSKPAGGIPDADIASAATWNAKGTYSKPSGGIPASDLASGVIPTVPSAYTSNPAALGTASAGSATSYARGDHVHPKPTPADIGAGTYSKPSGGIPASDLASAVQTSLGKADTALQSYTETDPTVPSWAKASSKPSYTASEVGAIAAPSSPSAGDFLVYTSNGWAAQTLSTWSGGSY